MVVANNFHHAHISFDLVVIPAAACTGEAEEKLVATSQKWPYRSPTVGDDCLTRTPSKLNLTS